MKIYKRYNPIQIARYVKTLFKGVIYIKDIGEFHFDQGRVLKPLNSDIQRLSIMSEINRQVNELQIKF
ncbi:DUF1107 domain-containing protein [Rosenbergiella australiborealis]|uniref:DUF1107 domain-containing protein n=1 Tax=Rosenbergiella australiborealis TaxID=1544696 RepID=A0ABS5T155_9GAMM|nr:DUF1107 domain-containing protein [Rosenbergiella australiborealis]